MVGSRSTASSNDDKSDDDSSVYFRGQLMSTPRPQPPATAPLSLASLGNARRVLRIRKEPVQEEPTVDLHRLTLLNTKLNSSYQTVEIELELERRQGARPPSPHLSFSKKVMPNGPPVRPWDQVMESGAHCSIKWGQTDLVDRGNREPMDDEVIIPIRSCLKSRQPEQTAAAEAEPVRKRLVVKKIVYDDDDEAALIDARTLVDKASEAIVKRHTAAAANRRPPPIQTQLKGKPPKRKQ